MHTFHCRLGKVQYYYMTSRKFEWILIHGCQLCPLNLPSILIISTACFINEVAEFVESECESKLAFWSECTECWSCPLSHSYHLQTFTDSLQDNWPSVLPTSRSQSSNLNFIPHNLTKPAAQKGITEEEVCSSQVVLTWAAEQSVTFTVTLSYWSEKAYFNPTWGEKTTDKAFYDHLVPSHCLLSSGVLVILMLY